MYTPAAFGNNPWRTCASGTTLTLLSVCAWRNPFVVAEQEQPVLLERPSQRAAELVLPERRNEDVCAKKLRESSALLRRNSNSEPCSALVPDCVTTLTCAPARFPYSAP